MQPLNIQICVMLAFVQHIGILSPGTVPQLPVTRVLSTCQTVLLAVKVLACSCCGPDFLVLCDTPTRFISKSLILNSCKI